MNPEAQPPINPDVAEGMRLRAKELQAKADSELNDDGTYESASAKARAEAARLIHERLEKDFDDSPEPIDFKAAAERLEQGRSDTEMGRLARDQGADDLRQAS